MPTDFLSLEDKVRDKVDAKPLSVKPARVGLWKNIGLAVGVYTVVELVIALTNAISWIETLAAQGHRRAEYEEKHKFMFEYLTPDLEKGFRLLLGKPPLEFLFEIDHYGFQKGEVDKNASIVAVGDSFCYGYGVSHGNVWSRVVERLLKRSLSNLGISGYDPWQFNEIIKSPPKSEFFDGKTVLYTLYANDLLPHTASHAATYYEDLGWSKFEKRDPDLGDLVAAFSQTKSFFEKTATVSLVHMFTHPHVNAVFKDSHGTDITLAYGGNQLTEEAVTDEGKQIVASVLDQAVDLIHGRKSVMVPVLIPSKIWLYREDYDREFGDIRHIVWEEEALDAAADYFKRRGISFIDMRPHFTDAHQRKGPYSLYLRRDGHLSSFGNYVMGLVIADHIKNQ